MRKGKEETRLKLQKYAKLEFLEKGYKNASLRNIVKRAGMTTGALFGYYPDKQSLFEGLVSEAAEKLRCYYMEVQKEFVHSNQFDEREACFDYSTQALHGFINMIYDHFEAFKLIVSCAEGTRYEGYIDELVEIEIQYSKRYYEHLHDLGEIIQVPDTMLLHILTNAYMSAIFETVAHDLEREAAISYVDDVFSFFYSGWQSLFKQNMKKNQSGSA